MVWTHYLAKKSCGGGGRPNLMLAQVHVFGALVLGLLDLTWDLDLT